MERRVLDTARLSCNYLQLGFSFSFFLLVNSKKKKKNPFTGQEEVLKDGCILKTFFK